MNRVSAFKPGDKQDIIKLYSEGRLNGRELARIYNVSDTTIYKILNTGHTKNVRDRNNKIREAHKNGIPIKKLAKLHNLSTKWISQIVSK
jgi:Mor family transcriptional regulator